MKVNVKAITGQWDSGFSLDKHTLSSTFIGNNSSNHPMFNTVRTDIGECLYQLKYRNDFTQAPIIARALFSNIIHRLPNNISFVTVVPPSRFRQLQPVFEIAKHLAIFMKKPYTDNLLNKDSNAVQIKNIPENERGDLLQNMINVNDMLNKGKWNALIIDDLYDTGSSLNAVTSALRNHDKINNIYVATVTRKRE